MRIIIISSFNANQFKILILIIKYKYLNEERPVENNRKKYLLESESLKLSILFYFWRKKNAIYFSVFVEC